MVISHGVSYTNMGGSHEIYWAGGKGKEKWGRDVPKMTGLGHQRWVDIVFVFRSCLGFGSVLAVAYA